MTLAAAAETVFGASLSLVVYAYFIYPVLIAIAAALRPKAVARAANEPTVSVVLAVWNEAANLERRIEDLKKQDYPADQLEIVVASDGSTDATAEILARLAAKDARLRPVVLESNGGKAVALNAGIAAATGELIVFADARQTFAPDAIRRLAENFADPAVGSASGELMLLPDAEGIAADVGLYWKYEKWIRRNESAFGSMLGATGAIYAIRRALYRPLPAGTLLDDFLTPMRIVLGGKRAIFDGRATACDRSSTKAEQEFRRKVRTLAGNFQACEFEPGLLWPTSNPGAWFQLWSHKLLRLAVPWALVAMLGASLCVPTLLFRILLLGQIAFYGLALAGWAGERAGRPLRLRAVSLAYTFTTLNLAAAFGLVHWLRGGSGQGLWRKAYTPAGE